MFSGVATSRYQTQPEGTPPRCEEVRFNATPQRHQGLSARKEATDEAPFELDDWPKRPCTMLLGWGDANGVQYEQVVELRPSSPYVTLLPPAFKRARASPLVRLSEMLGVAEQEAARLPEVNDPKELFCVSHKMETASGCPSGDFCPCDAPKTSLPATVTTTPATAPAQASGALPSTTANPQARPLRVAAAAPDERSRHSSNTPACRSTVTPRAAPS
jgi:hypothetical protein